MKVKYPWNRIEFTESEDEHIVYLYKQLYNSPKDISVYYNCHPSTIQRRLKKLGYLQPISIRAKTLKVNSDYFDKIDSEDKAYFLGLLYSDGCVSSSTARITIELQEEDSKILYLFKKYLDYSGELKFINRENKSNLKNTVRLQVFSKKLKEDLQNLGCIPIKSLILKFPTEKQVPNKYINHFIRGIFDGDGSINCNKNNSYTFSIAGTFDICESIKEILIDKQGLSKVKLYQPNKNKNTFILRYCGNTNCKKIYQFLYQDATIYLDRKHDTFLKFVYGKITGNNK